MIRLLLVCLFLFISSLKAEAFADQLFTVPEMVEECPHIIEGYVVRFTTSKESIADYYDVVRVKVLDNIQGVISERVIDVHFFNSLCPPGPQFYKGTYVLLFLDTLGGKYVSDRNRYGVKTLTRTEIAIYKERIRDCRNILQLPGEDDRHSALMAWLMKCGEVQATRREMSLMFIFNHDDRLAALTDQQKLRLKAAITRDEIILPVDLWFIERLCSNEEQRQMKAKVIAGMKRLKKHQFSQSLSYMMHFDRLADNPDVSKMIGKFERYGIDDKKPGCYKRLIRKFIRIVA